MRRIDTIIIGSGQAGFLRRRKSNFIDGVGDDAFEIAEHIHARRLRATA